MVNRKLWFYDSKYVPILSPAPTGHVVARMHIANFTKIFTVSPASSLHSETPASPPDYVLHPYTPDPQPALNATLPLYTMLY